jgi:DNA-binding NarL/FixJ family response regulator
LEDKKKLSADLILKLDRRLADYQDLLVRTEEAIKEGEKRLTKLAEGARGPVEREGPNPAAPETRAQVLRLAKKGLSVEEIALKSNLLRGEVELIINLEKDFSL